MLDVHLEPDVERKYRSYFEEYIDHFDDEPSDLEIETALHNYECSVYNELDRRIWSHI